MDTVRGGIKMLIRGVLQLEAYLKEQGAPLGKSSIYNLLRENKIPHKRPLKRVVVFDTDKIDAWLRIDETENDN